MTMILYIDQYVCSIGHPDFNVNIYLTVKYMFIYKDLNFNL